MSQVAIVAAVTLCAYMPTIPVTHRLKVVHRSVWRMK